MSAIISVPKPTPVSEQAQQAEPSQDVAPAALDEFARGWYDSSFDLRRGLWVIETDLDPAVTHGIVVRKRGHIGA